MGSASDLINNSLMRNSSSALFHTHEECFKPWMTLFACTHSSPFWYHVFFWLLHFLLVLLWEMLCNIHLVYRHATWNSAIRVLIDEESKRKCLFIINAMLPEIAIDNQACLKMFNSTILFLFELITHLEPMAAIPSSSFVNSYVSLLSILLCI